MSKKIERIRDQLRHVENDIARTKAQREAAIVTIVKAMEKLRLLDHDQRRIAKRLQKAINSDRRDANPEERILGKLQDAVNEVLATEQPKPVQDDVGIPEFLRARERVQDDIAAAEAIKAELVEQKLAKSRGRIAKLKAQKSGETRKMPLSGKAALNHIKGGGD